ncbi:glycosyltransferase family 2 protein [Methylotenera sp.]|uniref:glycosyltransferase family 2 protein n=1 Tax=Methylotenera sp. TaxID=2051956 RepID=UPI0024876ADE|nr:glycosyltransferase family 2 protein [Methylotenera sp.]MDI1299683.1 glycosyltransferase family 2 protein [Methylotenera sp.]
MKELCVVHLVRAQNGIEPFRRFLVSYQLNHGGINHDFLLVFKGFSQSSDLKAYREILKPFQYLSLEIPDAGFDLTAYFKAAEVFGNQYRFFCFLNSFSEVLDANWLKKLYQHSLNSEVGLVGASGSWQSHNINFKSKIKVIFDYDGPFASKAFWKKCIVLLVESVKHTLIRIDFPPFPNPHIRTNAFLISSSLINTIKMNPILSKYDAYKVESGYEGLSQQIMRMGKKILIIGKDGKAYKKEGWNKSQTFWQSNQDNLLVADNQTRDYQYGSLGRRRYLSMSAWQASVDIVTNLDIIEQPMVSVCIPVRNGGEFFHAALDSVLKQTYTNYELIVIDNASTDDTAIWVERLAAENIKIKFYKNEFNIGLIQNFNLCLSKVNGDYVKFLCADDFLMPNALEQMVSVLELNKVATLVTVGRLLVNQYDEVLGIKSYSDNEVVVKGTDAINRCLFGGNYIGEPSATMFRRDGLENRLNLQFPHLVDLELWFRLLEKGDLVSIPQPLCAIRRHELQMTQRNIQSGVLVEDNVRLFDMYKNKPYIKHTYLVKIERKMRMAYRVWICKSFIETKRKNEILRLQSSLIFYYLFIPVISLVIYSSRKIKNFFFSRFLAVKA